MFLWRKVTMTSEQIALGSFNKSRPAFTLQHQRYQSISSQKKTTFVWNFFDTNQKTCLDLVNIAK